MNNEEDEISKRSGVEVLMGNLTMHEGKSIKKERIKRNEAGPSRPVIRKADSLSNKEDEQTVVKRPKIDDVPVEVSARKYRVLRTRTSPRTFHDALEKLSEDQRNAVRSMNLGVVLDLAVHGIPSKLGYYVVDRLDTNEMSLRVGSGDIEISTKSIHEILGLPIEGVDLLAEDELEGGINIKKTWRMQFEKERMRPTDVINMILEAKDSGFLFKLNFLVLFVNVMAECHAQGACYYSFLGRLRDDRMVNNINWCKFVYDKIQTSKQNWKRNDDICFYTGPLTYLTLLYVHSTVSKRVEIVDKGPAYSVWNMGLLKKRELTEIEDGGFGKLPLKEHGRESKSTTEQNNSGHVGEEKIDTYFENVEDVVKVIETNIMVMNQMKTETNRLLKKSTSKFPQSRALDKLMSDFAQLFINGTDFEKTTASNSQVDGSITPCTSIILSNKTNYDIWGSPGFEKVVVKTAEKLEQRAEIMKFLLQMGEPGFDAFDLGISPIKNALPIQSIKHNEVVSPVTDKKGKKKQFEHEDLGENIRRDLSSELNGVNVDSEKIVGRITRRTTKPSVYNRSPYEVRAVDFNVSKDDERIHEWALSAFGSSKDPVYESKDMPTIDRISLEALAARNVCTTKKLINGWVGIMNYDERFRSDDSLRRFFFTLEVMDDPQLRKPYLDKITRYNIFKKSLFSASGNRKDEFKLRNTDLAFFPIADGDEYYAVVMNLKHPSIQILDNRDWKGPRDAPLLARYNHVTERLQQMVVHHMKIIGHSAVVGYEKIKQELVDVEWKTEYNIYDSGLFLMRHMETYMSDRNWDSGFTKDGSRQETQPENLKKKYVAKIIQHSGNLLTKNMLKEVTEYHKNTDCVKFEMQTAAVNTRWKRIKEGSE